MSVQLNSQTLELGQSFFTLRNIRVSPGFNVSGNKADDKAESIFNQFTGKLPDDVEIRFDSTQGLPNLSAGLSLDIFSPNSNIGFLLGLEYNHLTFQLVENESEINYFEIGKINIPAYLKWKFGKVHSRSNVFLTAGAVYGIPIRYSKKNNLAEIKGKDNLDNTVSLSSILGYQFRFVRKDNLESNTTNGVVNGEYTRAWLFLRADYLLDNTFKTDSGNKILSSFENSEVNYSDLSFTIGFAIFFGFQGR